MKSKYAKLFLIFLIFTIILSIMQFTTQYIIGFDGYYHAKSAEIIKKEGFVKDFTWAEHTILANNYADIQVLFRIILIPFTFLGLEFGAKIASIIFGALALAVFYWFLIENKIKYALFWSLLYLFTAESLMYRFQLTREMPITISLLIITIYFMQKKKYIFLGLTSLVFALFYSGFVLQLFIILAYFILEKIFSKKFDFNLIGYSFGGIFLGLLLNPYFPANISMLYIQIFKVNLISNLYNVEWKPWTFIDLIKNNVLVLVYIGISFFILTKNRKITKDKAFYFLLALFFLVYTIKSRRMQEYLVPFSILAVSFFINDFIIMLDKNKLKILKIVSVILLIIVGSVNFVLLKQDITNNNFLHNYNNCADWMIKNIPKNSLIFNNAYAFPYLFFKSHNLRYTHGIDLTYSYLYDPDEFERYIGILKGTIISNNDLIIEDYSPDYLFVGKVEQDIKLHEYVIKNKNNYKAVYEDGWCAILEVKNH